MLKFKSGVKILVKIKNLFIILKKTKFILGNPDEKKLIIFDNETLDLKFLL